MRVLDDGVGVEECLRAERFDLIVLDLMMPGMNGFEVLRQVRAGGESGWRTQPAVRVVALSGRAGEEGLEFARRIGANAVLGKPFELEDLWNVVEA